MKTIIAGSRGLYPIPEELDAIVRLSGFMVTEVVCGMAKGVDLAGKVWADERGIPVTPFPADWKPNGVFDPNAGFKRNGDMAVYADALIAIWDGTSNGTADMIKHAKRLGLRYYVLDLSKPPTTTSVLDF